MQDYLKGYADKVILVTGGAGSIGSNFCRALSALGPKLIIVLDDYSSAYDWNSPSGSNILIVKGA